jgi:hypothetical protein
VVFSRQQILSGLHSDIEGVAIVFVLPVLLIQLWVLEGLRFDLESFVIGCAGEDVGPRVAVLEEGRMSYELADGHFDALGLGQFIPDVVGSQLLALRVDLLKKVLEQRSGVVLRGVHLLLVAFCLHYRADLLHQLRQSRVKFCQEGDLAEFCLVDVEEELKDGLEMIALEWPVLGFDDELDAGQEHMALGTAPQLPEIGDIGVFGVELVIDLAHLLD